VYTSLAANDFLVTLVANNHFDPGAYSNATAAGLGLIQWTPGTGRVYKGYRDIANQTGLRSIELFSSMLEGHNASTPSYEDLTTSQCTNIYKTDFVSNHRNLFLIANYTSNATYNNTILDMRVVMGQDVSSSSWMCNSPQGNLDAQYPYSSYFCNANEFASNVSKGLPWQINLQVGPIGISGCKSEITEEKCKVHFSLGIMIVVICCNLVKACSMIMTAIRSREPTLVTLGDAVDSFLGTPDLTTIGICFADRRFIKREWRRGWRVGPRQWKQKGVQRWWSSVSQTRWITCNFFFLVTIIVARVLLRLGLRNDGDV